MDELADIRAKILVTEGRIAAAEAAENVALIVAYSNILTEQQKKENILLAGAGNLILYGCLCLFVTSPVYAYPLIMSLCHDQIYIPHSYNPHLTSYLILSTFPFIFIKLISDEFAFANYILIYLSNLLTSSPLSLPFLND
jgi:hypothetical protein